MYRIGGFPFLARVRDSDAARDGAVAERARVGGARRADDEVVAGEEEDGARAIHAISAPEHQDARAIHVYLGNISDVDRSVFDPETLEEHPFESDRYDAFCRPA
mgnify:CR=1 FL=1